jgi:STE24 endopeptidase
MTAMETQTIDPERQKKARIYARLTRRLMVVDLGLTAVYTLIWLFTGWSAGLKAGLLQVTANPWLLVPGYGFVFGAILFLIGLPLSYYEGFVLPHRFDTSTQTLRGWISDQVKGILLGGILGGILLEMIYAVLRSAPTTWWLWASLILLVFNVVLANLAPVLLMPLFYKFIPLGDEYADLAQRLVGLAEKAGTRVRGVYKFDMSRRTKAANAALTGLGNTRRIILGDTLLAEFSADEIETVMAHELGHQVNHDIPLGIVVETLSTLAGLWLASLVLQWGAKAFGFQGPADIAALPIFLLAMGVYGLLTMPLTNAFSRWRERRADAYALQATQNPRAFASAMTRLANQNLAEVDPEPWVEFLLYSHPALEKRIAMAQALQEDAPVS